MKTDARYGLHKRDYLSGVICLALLLPHVASNILMQFFSTYANSDWYEALAMFIYVGVALGGFFLMISFVAEIVLLVRAVRGQDSARARKKTVQWHLMVIMLVIVTFVWQSISGLGWNHGLQGSRQRERHAQAIGR